MMLAREQLREHALAPEMEFNEGFTFFLSNEVFSCRWEEGEPKVYISKKQQEKIHLLMPQITLFDLRFIASSCEYHTAREISFFVVVISSVFRLPPLWICSNFSILIFPCLCDLAAQFLSLIIQYHLNLCVNIDLCDGINSFLSNWVCLLHRCLNSKHLSSSFKCLFFCLHANLRGDRYREWRDILV